MSFLTTLLESHGAQAGEGLANHLGVPQDKATGLLTQLGPMILGAVKNQAGDDDEKVESLLNEHGDEAAVDDAAAHFAKPDDDGGLAAKAESLLGSDMGKKAIDVICDKLGVSESVAQTVLPKIISFVLGALNKKKGEAGGGSDGMSMVKGFLDQDGDGSIMDDLGDMLGGGKGDDDDGGGLGGLVGGLLGKK
ncbi:MAG: DUF937 domain-containing protein [Verrucomicrobiota bacterium]